ncbi:uncharacterized protein [Procambarus clarkii]|uniref:uncharacterized protein isoform X1 n=1 Tax=Procambarus clarkii TaxID=6728 RepID=UPI001E67620C|nr:uncharacterized protein LOC123757713 isoform X2 [Procambarus clarkii]
MAEGGPGTQTVLCRYFINNVCNKGDQCRFSHDPAVAQPSMFCRYYLKGTCAYGDKCRYEHSVPEYVGKIYAPQSNAAPAPAPASNRPDGLNANYNVKVPGEPPVPSSQPNALSTSVPVGGNNIPHRLPPINQNTIIHQPVSNGISSAREMIKLVAVSITQFVAMILDAHRLPHNLPTFNNRKNMSIEDARSSAKNLQAVVINFGSTIYRCMNCATPDVLLELGNLLINFWADAKEPCPNLSFTSDDLAQVVTSPDGRHFLQITLAQLENLMATLKSLLN